MKQYDLIVVGGGLTGTCAAIAAGRAGKRVLILEQSNALGGAINTMAVLPYMPYFTPAWHEAPPIYLSRGIFREITERQIALSRELEGDAARYTTQPLQQVHDEYIKILLPRMVHEAGGDILYHATLIGAECTDGTVRSVRVAANGVEFTLSAPMFIDCTGNASLAVACGFPTHLGREGDHLCQPMTLCFRLSDVDPVKFRANRKLIHERYLAAKERGEITNPREDVLVFDAASPNGLHFNTTRIILHDPTDPFALSEAEEIAREQVYEMYRFLRKYAPGCERAILEYTPAHIGIRESRMIEGLYTLTQDDLVACRKFEDGIAACNYDIDIHNPEGTGTSHYYFKPYTYYTIPYRCLVPVGSRNLLVAGRCISSDHAAQASYRILPVVATLGEAAGVAAGVCLDNATPVADADIREIQDRLRAEGAFFGAELDEEPQPPYPKN